MCHYIPYSCIVKHISLIGKMLLVFSKLRTPPMRSGFLDLFFFCLFLLALSSTKSWRSHYLQQQTVLTLQDRLQVEWWNETFAGSHITTEYNDNIIIMILVIIYDLDNTPPPTPPPPEFQAFATPSIYPGHIPCSFLYPFLKVCLYYGYSVV